MAAYASLVSLQQTTNLILHHHRYIISAGERGQVTSIREYVNLLIPFFENFPEKAHSLEGKIRDLANEAEDVIEYFMWYQVHMDRSVGACRVGFEGRLNRVREQIGSITGDLLDNRFCYLPAAISSSAVASSSKNNVVIGLDEAMEAIKDRLFGSSKLEVIPILGMGGIGKTTLARYIYDDSVIMGHFHIRAFVQVSQDFSAKQSLSKLLASIKLFEKQMLGETSESEVAENVCNESEIAENVYKGLKGRRYLIVLDDIWSTQDWYNVTRFFPDDKNGSRIMLTTRLSDVASYASCGSSLHEMEFMDENQSWYLLKQKVFPNGGDCPPELEDIAKEIARNCRGLPLAIVLMAGILSTVVKTRASWEKTAKSVNPIADGPLDKILSLSYRHLPHHLRPCFLFMAGFPEDYNISASKLIKLWVAEGFLKCQNERKSLEGEAEECLDDLVKRNLVLITRRKSNGKIKGCSLHDLVRDMCIKKAQDEKFLLTDRHVIPKRGKDGRRISVGRSHLNEIWCPRIHTILCFQIMRKLSSLAIVEKFRLLRVLDVVHYYSATIPPQVFELFHLRYLALGFRVEIPAGISKLVNLQTLIIRTSLDLPVEIWMMPHLRHLVFTGLVMLPYPMDRSILPLENLQTLSGLVNFEFSTWVTKLIPKLKKLGITYCATLEQEHRDLCDLASLHQLEKLKITVISYPYRLKGKFRFFPRTLIKLSLVGVEQLPWEDMSLVGSLPNLQVLKLKEFASDGDTWETSNGEFPQLKFLLIDGSNLRHWITERLHFPRLERLVLSHCPNLQEIPDSIGEIPTLELIEVDDWSAPLVNSAKRIQEDQQSYGNDTLQVKYTFFKKQLFITKRWTAPFVNLAKQDQQSYGNDTLQTCLGQRKRCRPVKGHWKSFRSILTYYDLDWGVDGGTT